MTTTFTPYHMNATTKDFEGNAGKGRYILLPGSDGRASKMATHMNDVDISKHPRGHNLYKGTIRCTDGKTIDVGIISSGMGCPSLDIIVNELFKLGARTIIRVGTSGSVQPKRIRVGALVVPTASVRDEATSSCYMPSSVPAMASFDLVNTIHRAAQNMKIEAHTHFGPVHSKDSLYAREFGEGPMQEENKKYMAQLNASGILASEMECSQLFTLGMVYGQRLQEQDAKSFFQTAAILSIIGDDTPFADPSIVATAIDESIRLAFETLMLL